MRSRPSSSIAGEAACSRLSKFCDGCGFVRKLVGAQMQKQDRVRGGRRKVLEMGWAKDEVWMRAASAHGPFYTLGTSITNARGYRSELVTEGVV